MCHFVDNSRNDGEENHYINTQIKSKYLQDALENLFRNVDDENIRGQWHSKFLMRFYQSTCCSDAGWRLNKK